MRRLFRLLALTLFVPATVGAAPRAAGWKIPIEVKKLQNALTVLVSEDHTAPTLGTSTAYRIGFRPEPKGRTGIAHLFEHMMFEGTPA
jgi:predicted Zn-dependent peptidase